MRILGLNVRNDESQLPFRDAFKRLVLRVSKNTIPPDAALMLALLDIIENALVGSDVWAMTGHFGLTFYKEQSAAEPACGVMVGKRLSTPEQSDVQENNGLVFRITDYSDNHCTTDGRDDNIRDSRSGPVLVQFDDVKTAAAYLALALDAQYVEPVRH